MIRRFLLSRRIIHVIITTMIPIANMPATAPPIIAPRLSFDPESVVPEDGLVLSVVVDTAVEIAVTIVGVVVTFAPLLPPVEVTVVPVPVPVVCAATLSGRPAVLQYPSYAVTACESSPVSPQFELMHEPR
jgi:hypothetical protein